MLLILLMKRLMFWEEFLASWLSSMSSSKAKDSDIRMFSWEMSFTSIKPLFGVNFRELERRLSKICMYLLSSL